MSKATEALDALKSRSEPMLVPEDIAPVLGVAAHSIRIQAQEDPRMLGFRVSRVGNKTLIPRVPFIAFIEEGA